MDLEKLKSTLKAQGVADDRLDAASQAVAATLPPKTYNTAMFFLGAVTLLLAVGAVLLPAYDKIVADALWGALGAGIGGLAGIFMTRD